MANKKRNSFYIQGTILAAASVISRLLGLAYRIPLIRILGDEGSAPYSNAYQIYNIALLLSTFSMPVAISRLVSAREAKKEYKNSFRVFKQGFVVSATAGFIMTALVYFYADFLAETFFKSPSTALPIRMLAPTIFVFSIMGVLRGFFQGKNTVIPTSISQILEQIVHVVCSLVFANLFLDIFSAEVDRYAYGAAGATLGTLAGALIALVFLLGVYFLYRPTLMRRLKKDTSESTEEYSYLFYTLILTVFPIILNQVLYSITQLLDHTLLNNILYYKGVPEAIRDVYISRYSNKFVLLTNVPIAIASAIGVAIIPNVVNAITGGNKKEIYLKVHQAIKFNMMIAIPCTFGLMVLAGPIMTILFKDSSDMTSNLMMLGGLSIVFFSYSTTTNSILQGIGKLKFPVIHAAIGIAVYLITDISLLYFTNLDVYALAIGYMVFPFTICVLNWIRIRKELRYNQELIKTFVLPTIFSVYMAAIAYFSYKGIYLLTNRSIISLIVAILVGMLSYGILMIMSKTLTREEIIELPMGLRFVKLLEKIGIRL